MDLLEKVRKILIDQYGICSDEELMKALESQQAADIGIFISNCGMTGGNDVKTVG